MFDFKKFEGKLIVRTQAVIRSTTMDRSYMGDPIEILKVDDKIAIYKGQYSKKPLVLAADYLDENWQEIPEQFVEQFKY